MAYDRLLLISPEANSFIATAAGTVSGGDIVMYATSADAVGSAITTYNAADIKVLLGSGTAAAHHQTVVGIAAQTVASGTPVKVFTDGLFILPCGSNGVAGGKVVSFVGYANCVESTADIGSGTYIGRALTAGTSEANFAIVRARF